MKLIPLHTLGSDGWKIAAALMSRHIGGAVNYVAVSEAFGVSSSALAAGLAADNLLCAVYFTTVFALASRIPKDSISDVPEVVDELKEGANDGQGGPRAYLLQNAVALALSSIVCTCGTYLTQALSIPGGTIPSATILVVLLATVCPSWVAPLAPAGETLAIIFIQIFFAVQLLLLASNANVGGPTTAAGLATAKGWKSLIVPGILAGIFGVAIATFISIFLGVTVLKFL
ncbi:hypothetical protein GOP47_0023060 [Adiantum capillus-veneris]|uniref:Uncharacterized protein n=1 Tax=Adiantum capillus-veneris TaxID=13818 RepID=A0A9D4U8W9_ADICA|nr:hypothetical protein GOP47_0023060 [Adiantum capillus-veneris]